MSRVLVYSDRGDIFGAEQVNHQLALGFAGAGFDVAVAQPHDENRLVAERAARGITNLWLPGEDVYDWRHPAPSLSDPSAAEACLDAAAPDVVLFADSFPLANLAAKRAALARGVPYLVLVHCVQPLWARQYRAFVPALPELYAGAVEVMAVSQENLGLLRSSFGLAAERGTVVHNGRPASFFAPRSPERRAAVRAELAVAPDDVLALTVGRMEPAKGYHHLLAALPILRQSAAWERLAFAWVGRGSLGERVGRFARLLGGGKVRVLAEHHDVPALLDAADLLVHPAEFEGMPLVVLEAMAKGLPIVASSVSGIPEALGETGVLLPAPSDDDRFPARLAAAIADLAADPVRRAALGAAAADRARRLFTEQRMLDAHLALLRRALGAR